MAYGWATRMRNDEFRIVMGAFEVGLGDPDTVDFTQRAALAWMAVRAKCDPSVPGDFSADSLREGAGGTVEWAGSGDTWAARLRQPDRSPMGRRLGRVFTVEVAVRSGGRAHAFAYRMHCSNPVDVKGVQNIPTIVREVSSELGLYDAGHELLPTACEVADGPALDGLVSLIEDPARTRPVLLVGATAGDDGLPRLPFDADALADKVFTLHHVFVLHPAMSDALTDRLGPDFDLRPGSIRSYRPGFDQMSDHPTDHPAASLRTVVTWEGGPPAFAAYLAGRAFQASVRDTDAWAEFPTVDQVRAAPAAAPPAAPRG